MIALFANVVVLFVSPWWSANVSDTMKWLWSRCIWFPSPIMLCANIPRRRCSSGVEDVNLRSSKQNGLCKRNLLFTALGATHVGTVLGTKHRIRNKVMITLLLDRRNFGKDTNFGLIFPTTCLAHVVVTFSKLRVSWTKSYGWNRIIRRISRPFMLMIHSPLISQFFLGEMSVANWLCLKDDGNKKCFNLNNVRSVEAEESHRKLWLCFNNGSCHSVDLKHADHVWNQIKCNTK